MLSKNALRKFQRYGIVPENPSAAKALFDSEVREARKRIYRKPRRSFANSMLQIKRKRRVREESILRMPTITAG